MAFSGLVVLVVGDAGDAGQRSPAGLGEICVVVATARLPIMYAAPIITKEMVVYVVGLGHGKATMDSENVEVSAEVLGRKSLGHEISRAPSTTSFVSVLAMAASPCRCQTTTMVCLATSASLARSCCMAVRRGLLMSNPYGPDGLSAPTTCPSRVACTSS